MQRGLGGHGTLAGSKKRGFHCRPVSPFRQFRPFRGDAFVSSEAQYSLILHLLFRRPAESTLRPGIAFANRWLPNLPHGTLRSATWNLLPCPTPGPSRSARPRQRRRLSRPPPAPAETPGSLFLSRFASPSHAPLNPRCTASGAARISSND